MVESVTNSITDWAVENLEHLSRQLTGVCMIPHILAYFFRTTTVEIDKGLWPEAKVDVLTLPYRRKR